MFHKPKPNLIESDEGFSVAVLGQTGLRYSEGERAVTIDSEVLMGPTGMILYPTSMTKWDSPFDNERISDEKRRQILGRVKAAFRFEGFEIDFD